ncbi:MAG TPA: R body protein [Blastocatellia bacterium]|nr:R body protein [Blastocatellia bacterium]
MSSRVVVHQGDAEYEVESFSALPNDIRESVAIGNLKSVAEQSSLLSNLTYADLLINDNLSQQNAVSNQQGMNQLGITVAGKVDKLVASLNPLEATALAKLDTGNDISEQLADIKGTLQSFRRAAYR